MSTLYGDESTCSGRYDKRTC